MSAHELIELTDALDIPEVIKMNSGYVFEAIEAVSLTLARFRTAGD